jgi:ABC-type sugar transport system permease subunit
MGKVFGAPGDHKMRTSREVEEQKDRTTAIAKEKRGRRLALKGEDWFGISLILPALIAVFSIVMVPFISSLILSFYNRDLSRPQFNAFIGLKNYINLLSDARFLNSLQVTTVFALVSVVIEVALAIGIATVLNQAFRGRGFVRGLIILPWALPSVVNAAMWKWIFNADYGALNALLTQLGIIDQYHVWLAEPKAAMSLLILANVWKETPFATLLFLAALQAIPDEFYEAARVDGASGWQQFTYITLRLLLPTILIAGLLQIIWGFQTFELAYLVTGGGPFSSTELISLRIYAQTFRSLRFGYGAAMAYLTSLFLLIPAIFYIRAAYRSIVEY